MADIDRALAASKDAIEQMTQWNTARPEWRFRQLKEFTRNSQRAVHRLANPFGPLRLK